MALGACLGPGFESSAAEDGAEIAKPSRTRWALLWLKDAQGGKV